MTLLENFYTDWRHKDAIADDAKAALDEFILTILSRLGINNVGVESISIEKTSVMVDYGWSCRGNFNSKNIVIPISVFQAKDPLAAADKFKIAREALRQTEKINEKKALIKKLQDDVDREEGK